MAVADEESRQDTEEVQSDRGDKDKLKQPDKNRPKFSIGSISRRGAFTLKFNQKMVIIEDIENFSSFNIFELSAIVHSQTKTD